MDLWHDIDRAERALDPNLAPGSSSGPFEHLNLADAVYSVYGQINDYRDRLPQNLSQHVSKAVAKRQREFAAGRYFAARALQNSGSAAREVAVHAPHSEHPAPRAPVWPAGRIGSISHSTERAWVAVTQSSAWRGIGIDLEQLGRVETNLFSAVFTPHEIKKYSTPSVDPRWPETVFSAKEAVYKAINPIVGKYIGFTEAEVDMSFAPGSQYGEFSIRYLGEHEPNELMSRGHGYFAICDQHTLCLFLLPHE